MTGICEACGRRGYVEKAHIVAAGAGRQNGCGCAVNLIRLCWRCHRLFVHGVNGGWGLFVEKLKEPFRKHVLARIDKAMLHYHARMRGEPLRCNRKSKLADMARKRVLAAGGVA